MPSTKRAFGIALFGLGPILFAVMFDTAGFVIAGVVFGLVSAAGAWAVSSD